jgi:hypothetical protein
MLNRLARHRHSIRDGSPVPCVPLIRTIARRVKQRLVCGRNQRAVWDPVKKTRVLVEGDPDEVVRRARACRWGGWSLPVRSNRVEVSHHQS